MHICYLINQLAPGGAPTLLLDLVRNVDDADTSFTVCFLEGEDELVNELEAASAQIVDLGADFKFDPRMLARLARFLRTEEYDLLHAHLPYSQTLGRLFAPRDVPVVSTQHNVPGNYHPVTRTLERITRPLDDATIACSEGVEDAFRGDTHRYDGTLDKQWCTIYNGIDVDRFSTAVREADGDSIRDRHGVGDGTLFLNVARYVPAKAQEDIVVAMQQVVESWPDAHLLIVGWGKREAELEATVDTYGLDTNVTITGRVPSVHPYYAAADAFISSSTFEGLPITHLEAMAASLPVIATDIPGVREVVTHGEKGLLIPPNSPPNIADAMVEMSDAETRRTMGELAYRHVKNQFSIEQTVESHLTLYRQLVNG